MAVFCGQMQDAESILLQSGLIYRAIQMYLDLYNWDRLVESLYLRNAPSFLFGTFGVVAWEPEAQKSSLKPSFCIYIWLSLSRLSLYLGPFMDTIGYFPFSISNFPYVDPYFWPLEIESLFQFYLWSLIKLSKLQWTYHWVRSVTKLRWLVPVSFFSEFWMILRNKNSVN